MPVGMEIINDFGSVQIDQNYFNMQFIQKGSCTLNTRVYDIVPSSNPFRSQLQYTFCNTNGIGHPSTGTGQLVAFRPRFSDRPVGIGYTTSGSWQFIGESLSGTPPVVDWWLFGRGTSSSSNAGMEVYDASGNLTYTTAAKPMKIVAVKNDIPMDSGDTSITTSTAGDYALCAGTPFPYILSYQYNGTWQILEAGPMWSPPTSTGFAAPAFPRQMMGRGDFTNTPAGGIATRTTLMLVDVGNIGDTPVDVSIDAINWGNISFSTNSNIGTGSNTAPAALSGFNQPVTMRATVSNYTGSVSSGTLKIYKSVGGVYELQASSAISANGQYVETTISAGDLVYFEYTASTTASRKDVSFTVNVINVTQSNTLMDTFTVAATVDADNNYTAPDTTMDAADWANISGSSNSNSVTAANAAKTITGINQTINLRATISGYSGNLSTGYLQMMVNGSSVGTTGNMSSGAFIGSNVSVNDQVYFVAYGDTASGIRTGSYTVTVQNITTGDTIDTFTVGLTADADNNFNNSGDYTPNAVNWSNVNASSFDDSGFSSDSNTGTISGINQTVSMRLALTSTQVTIFFNQGFGSSASLYVSVLVNGTQVAGTSYDAFGTGTDNFGNRNLDFTVVNGDVVSFAANFYVSGSGQVSGSASASCTVQNLSTSSSTLDTFSISADATYDDGLGGGPIDPF